jgi:Spy/CpxP family protein refolding chaperone
MVETNRDARPEAAETPFWRRRRFWLGGTVAGIATLVAAAPFVGAHGFAGRAFAHGFGHGHGHGHGFGAQVLKDPEAAKRHAGLAVEWALRGVKASDEQMQRARAITDRLIDELGPLAARHREHRAAMHQAFAGGQVDRAALEQLRGQELALADQASRLAVEALADVAETLTPEQRKELLAFAHRFHGGPAAE